MILVRKIKKSEDFLQIFGMWIMEEISETSVKFRQNSHFGSSGIGETTTPSLCVLGLVYLVAPVLS